MLTHPHFNPVAVSLGPISIHWYGLMYLVAFVLFVVLGRRHARRRPELGWDAGKIDDLLLYGMLGVVIGGRLGEVVFFQLPYYLDNPLEIFAIWKGGMSFHGGFLGVLVAMALYARRHGRSFWQAGRSGRSPTSLHRWCRPGSPQGESATSSTASSGVGRPLPICRGQ